MNSKSNHFNESAAQWGTPDKIERAKLISDKIKF